MPVKLLGFNTQVTTPTGRSMNQVKKQPFDWIGPESDAGLLKRDSLAAASFLH